MLSLTPATLRRIVWIQVALMIAGLIIWGLARQRLGLLSFTFGALISTACFFLLSRAILAATSGRISAVTAVTSTLRLLIAGVIIHVILRTYEVLPIAAVCGILTPVAAITLEAIYELIYARTP
jgi:hypothetical protein